MPFFISIKHGLITCCLLFLLSACATTPPRTAHPKPAAQVYTPTTNPDQTSPSVVTAPQPTQNQAILQLDTLGHTALIRDIIIDQDNNIISASDDKTIRVWDSVTGKEKRKILGQIGSGSGEIYAIALSADNRYLAAGGFLTKGGVDDKVGNIRIYDYPSGQLLQVLKSHSNVVNDLAFSPDDRYLVSGSADKTIKLWDTQSWKLQETIAFHANHVYGVKMLTNSQGGYDIYSVAYENKIALHRFNKHAQYITHYQAPYKLQYLASNGVHIATSGKGKEIRVFDRNLQIQKTIHSETQPSGLAYSPDGTLLVAGTRASPLNTNLYETTHYQRTASFKKHSNLTQAVAFLDNHTVVSGGGSNNEIYLWNTTTTAVQGKIVGVGNSVWSVGINGDRIAWGDVDDCNSKNCSKLQKSIQLTDLNITPIATENFQRISTDNGSYHLSHTQGGDYGYSDAVLEIKKNGQLMNTIVKDSSTGYRHRCYGWYDDFIISGGNNGDLKIYTKAGKEVASLIGHTGEVWSIALDQDRLVSGSGDQTIRVWDLSVLHQANPPKKIYPLLNIFVSEEDEFVVWSESGYFTASTGGDKYVGYHINKGADKAARYVGSDKYFDTLYRPDIIHAIWQTGSEKKAIAYAAKTKKVATVAIADSLPPVVTLLSKNHLKTTSNTITIEYAIDSTEPITKTLISLNGRAQDTRGLRRQKYSTYQDSITITLEDGENIIALRAKNKFALSDEVLVYVEKQTTRVSQAANIYKPTLYLLSIGVSDYANSEYNLNVAHADARDIVSLFKQQEGKIYQRVVAKTLLNSAASSDNILDGLDWIDREATSKDVVIIFIAGHGINDEKGNYYFLGHDANIDSLRRTAVKWLEIEDTISNLPSKVILLADTCHSGNITGTRRDITGAIKSIINSGTGSIIMTATTGAGYSYEQSNWGHGAFTKAFLEGLGEAKADYDRDGSVTIKEIDLYVTNRVKSLTKGKQKPTTIIPDSIPDFAIGVQ